MKIVISDCSWNAYEVEKQYLPAEAEVVCAQVKSEEDILKICKDADAVLSEYGPYTRRVLEQLPKLKIISNSAMGVDNIDLKAAKELGIAVANVPDYCVHEVAEHAMALILAALRNIPGYNSKMREGIWDFAQTPKLYRIHGSTLGLIGCGRIPRKVAAMAHGFGMRVIGHARAMTQAEADQYGIELVSLEQLAAESDAILNQLPLTAETEHFVNKDFFDMVKKQPVFVNTSRGATVDQAALCDALRTGKISAAGLDVLDQEPPDFSDEIFSFENVIFTPHAAFYSETALEEVRRRSALNVTNFLAGNLDQVEFVVKP